MTAKRKDPEVMRQALALVSAGKSPEQASDELRRRGHKCSGSTIRRELKRREAKRQPAAADPPTPKAPDLELPPGATLVADHETIVDLQGRLLIAFAAGTEPMDDDGEACDRDTAAALLDRIPRSAHSALAALMAALAGYRLTIVEVDGERLELVDGVVP